MIEGTRVNAKQRILASIVEANLDVSVCSKRETSRPDSLFEDFRIWSHSYHYNLRQACKYGWNFWAWRLWVRFLPHLHVPSVLLNCLFQTSLS
jgi:hypothetical protein